MAFILVCVPKAPFSSLLPCNEYSSSLRHHWKPARGQSAPGVGTPPGGGASGLRDGGRSTVPPQHDGASESSSAPKGLVQSSQSPGHFSCSAVVLCGILVIGSLPPSGTPTCFCLVRSQGGQCSYAQRDSHPGGFQFFTCS